jgi:hypothetical protein
LLVWDDQEIEEVLGNGESGLGVQCAIQGNDAPEGRDRIGLESALEGFVRSRCHSDTTGCGVLHDDSGWLGKALDELPSGHSIEHVVVGKRSVTNDLPSTHLGSNAENLVDDGALVRIFSIAERLEFPEWDRKQIRKFFRAQIAGDLGIVGRQMGEGFGGESPSGLMIDSGDAKLGEPVGDRFVITRITDRENPGKILGGSAQQCWPADVDQLESDILGCLRRDVSIEGVQVDSDQLDGGDTVLCQLGQVSRAIVPSEYGSMYGGVKRFHSSFEQLRKTSQLRDLAYR